MISATSNPVPASLEDELFEEVKAQLTRKVSSLFGGKLELANGVLLYENQLSTGREIHHNNYRKDGEKNESTTIFGHHFESLEAGRKNRESILNNTNHVTCTTDQLSKMSKNGTLPANIPPDLAKKNHTQVDLVTFDKKTGKIVKTYQLKVLGEKTAIHAQILKERYLTAKGAPGKILVASDTYERIKGKLEEAGKKASNDPEKLEKIRIALEKLEKGDFTSKQSKSPQTTVLVQTSKDFGMRMAERSGKLILSEVVLITVGGAVWEVKDAIANQSQMTVEERLERLLSVVWDKISNSMGLKLKKELALEIFNFLAGTAANIFKSAKDLISLIGKQISQVWDAIFNYITGRIASFHELVLTILKTITTVGLAALAMDLELTLTGFGLPSILAGLLSASVLAVAIVLTNRCLDAVVMGLVASFSKAEAAKLRAEQVAAKCRELLPTMIEQQEELAALTQKIHDEREAILASSFQTLNSPQGRRDVNLAISVLEDVNQAFGASLGFHDFDEFDGQMLSEAPMRL